MTNPTPYMMTGTINLTTMVTMTMTMSKEMCWLLIGKVLIIVIAGIFYTYV